MSIEKDVADIQARNKKVELDKAWETSLLRRFCIVLVTYVTSVTLLFLIGNKQPFINAMVPVCGYVLSTLSLRVIREIWEKRS